MKNRIEIIARDKIRAKVIFAMEILRNMPCGGVGDDSVSLETILAAESNDRYVRGEATYHLAQKTWLALREVLGELEWKHGKYKL